MEVQTRGKETAIMENEFADKAVNVCKGCGNTYKSIWLKAGDEWNDFGFRYCPFCGAQTEEFAHIC